MRRRSRVIGRFLIPGSSPSGISLPVAAGECSLIIYASSCQGLPATLILSGDSPASGCILDSNLHFSKGPRLSANRTHWPVHCPHPGVLLRGGNERTSTRTGPGGRTGSEPKPREAASHDFRSALRPNDTRQCQEPAVPVPARVPVRSSRDRRGPQIGTTASDRARGSSLPVAAPPENGAATGRKLGWPCGPPMEMKVVWPLWGRLQSAGRLQQVSGAFYGAEAPRRLKPAPQLKPQLSHKRCAYGLSVESLFRLELNFMRFCGPKAHRHPLSFAARCYYVLRLRVPQRTAPHRPLPTAPARVQHRSLHDRRPVAPNDEDRPVVPQHRTANEESGQCQRAVSTPDRRSFHSRFCAGGGSTSKCRGISLSIFRAAANDRERSPWLCACHYPTVHRKLKIALASSGMPGVSLCEGVRRGCASE
jgi:hypothetical protein